MGSVSSCNYNFLFGNQANCKLLMKYCTNVTVEMANLYVMLDVA
jgi:hypothetical protein